MTCRLKPGSFNYRGDIVDWKGQERIAGPCWIPADLGVRDPARRQRRRAIMREFGWIAAYPSERPYTGFGSVLWVMRRVPF